MSLQIESTSSPRSQDLIKIFLKNQHSGVLATADSVGNPHAAVIYFVLDDDFSILFTTKRETQKCKNIEENNQAALVVYDEPTQTTAQIFGHTEFVNDEKIRDRIIENMGNVSMERSIENIPPVAKLVAGEYVVVRINPTVIKMAEYGFAKPGDENLFETILFSK
jgi:general stress protein 26